MSNSWTPYTSPASSGNIPILAGGLINTVNSGGGILAKPPILQGSTDVFYEATTPPYIAGGGA